MSALASIYMNAIETDCHIDYRGKLFAKIFEKQPTVWKEYVDWVKSKDNMREDWNESEIFELIWESDKWRECVAYAFNVLVDDERVFYIKNQLGYCLLRQLMQPY